jgi:hypothetical protein
MGCRRLHHPGAIRQSHQGLPLPPRDHIAERVLFDENIRKILREYDSYARAEPERDPEPVAARFHALRGKELGFSPRSLKRWLLLRRRYGLAAPKLKR